MQIPAVIDLPLSTEPDGTIRIGNTRVTLDVVITEYLNGSPADEIASNFDALNAADVHFAIGYYLAHRAEIDTYLAHRAAEADQIRRKLEAMPGHKPLTVEMLEARRKKGGMF